MALQIVIALVGALVSVGGSVLGAHLTFKKDIKQLKINKSVEVYEKLLGLFSRLCSDPTKVFDLSYLYECDSLMPFVDVYADDSIRTQFSEFREEAKTICYQYQECFRSDEKRQERNELIHQVPFAEELQQREEEDYMVDRLIDSGLLPDKLQRYMDAICSMIRKQVDIKEA